MPTALVASALSCIDATHRANALAEMPLEVAASQALFPEKTVRLNRHKSGSPTDR